MIKKILFSLLMILAVNPAFAAQPASYLAGKAPNTQRVVVEVERTLSIIKPDAIKRNLTGAINERFERAGFRIVAQKRLRLTEEQAKQFYIMHKDKPYYNSLVSYMISGPVVVQVLQAENAVIKYRELIGVVNPKDAAPGTIRRDFGESIEANSVHGSTSLEEANNEIAFFFSKIEICE